MDFWKYLLVLICFCLESQVSGGGHGKHKHEVIKIHVPEIIKHDHHTKYIVIHHHPKKHHHHHHHHKPHIHKPHGHHHYFYHKKKGHKKSHTATHSHGHHGHHGHGHKHVPHHHHKEAKKPHHHDDSGQEQDEYIPYTPQSYHPHSFSPKIPKVYGVTHTFKEVKMYDSLPPGHNSYQSDGGSFQHDHFPTNSYSDTGYQVTEPPEDDENNGLRSVSGYPQTYGSNFGYQPQKDIIPFPAFSPQPVLKDSPVADFPIEYEVQGTPDAEFDYSPAEEYPGSALGNSYGYGNPGSALGNSYAYGNPEDIINYGQGGNYFTDEHKDFMDSLQPDNGSQLRKVSEELPASFERAFGVQKTVKTAGHETISY